MSNIRVSVQASPTDLASWLTLARTLESSGFSGLLLGDHPGSAASPWPALGCAAAVTRTLTLGSYVVQAGVREPIHVAAEAATLDILAPGRVLLGIGAGHTPREWENIGHVRPAPRQRAERLTEFVDAVVRLLRGEIVTRGGQYLTLRDSRLEHPLTGRGVRLAVGGGHPEVLRAAARHADVVGLAGLGRTLADGHHHEARWNPADLQRQLRLVREEAEHAGRAPIIEALVHVVTVTKDRAAVADEIARCIPGTSAQDVTRTPFALIGTHGEMAAQMRRQSDEFGITSYVVRDAALPDLTRVLALLNSQDF